MHVQKLLVSKDAGGLVPVGRYFEKLAQALREANAQESAQQEKRDAQDRRLEQRYRRAARGATYVRTETHAPM